MCGAATGPLAEALLEPLATSLSGVPAEPLARSLAVPLFGPLAELLSEPLATSLFGSLAEAFARSLVVPLSRPLAEALPEPLATSLSGLLAERLARSFGMAAVRAVVQAAFPTDRPSPLSDCCRARCASRSRRRCAKRESRRIRRFVCSAWPLRVSRIASGAAGPRLGWPRLACRVARPEVSTTVPFGTSTRRLACRTSSTTSTSRAPLNTASVKSSTMLPCRTVTFSCRGTSHAPRLCVFPCEMVMFCDASASVRRARPVCCADGGRSLISWSSSP